MAMNYGRIDPIKIDGLYEVIRALEAAGEPKEAVRKAGSDAADYVLKQALYEVPVRSGDLRRSMRKGVLRDSVQVRAGGARVPYANPIHWGWLRKHIKPNPWFSRVLGYSREEIFRNYREQMERYMDDLRKRGKIL